MVVSVAVIVVSVVCCIGDTDSTYEGVSIAKVNVFGVKVDSEVVLLVVVVIVAVIISVAFCAGDTDWTYGEISVV